MIFPPLISLLEAAAWFLGAVIVALIIRRAWNRGKRRHPLARVVEDEGAGLTGWLLTMAVAVAAFMGVAAAWLLVFVSFVCFFYAAGLVYGEILHLVGVLPPTAGNVLFHLTFPAQMFLMGLFTLLLVLGPMQIVIGPLPARRFVYFRVEDTREWVSRMAVLLGLTAALELARTVMAGAILEPEGLLEFFARGETAPLSDPTGLALLAAATVIGALLLARMGRKS